MSNRFTVTVHGVRRLRLLALSVSQTEFMQRLISSITNQYLD